MIISISDKLPVRQETLYEGYDTSNIVPSVWTTPGSLTGSVPESIAVRARKISMTSYYSNFIYHRLIDLIVDTILTAGFDFNIPEDKKEQFTQFWFGFPNNIEHNLRGWLTELLIMGEMFWIFDRNPYNNKIYVSTISPLLVKELVPSKADSRTVDRIVVQTDQGEKEFINLQYKPTEEKITGNAYAFLIGKYGDQLRGLPPFIASLDFLNEFQSFAFAYLRGSAFRNSIWFKVTYSGATLDELESFERMKGKYPPVPNSIIATNERVNWEILDPRVTANTDEQAKFLLDLILNSTDVPSFIFSGNIPDQITAFSGIQSLIAIQEKLANDFSIILKMAVDDMDASCVARPMITRDTQRLSGAILRLVNSALAAKEAGIYSDEETRKLLDKFYALIGVEV